MTGVGPIRALVVDDSGFFTETVVRTLAAQHGIDATHETSAEDALGWLGDSAVDCVVSDYELPGMDGLAFLERVQDRYDDLPFVLLMGRGDEGAAGEAIDLGADDSLLKLEVAEDERSERLANRIEGVVTRDQPPQNCERLLEHIPDAVAHVAVSGEIIAANPALADRLGVERDELVGSGLSEVFEKQVAEAHLETGRRVVQTGVPEWSEDSYNGRHFRTLFVPVATRGEPDSFQLVSRDVTERRECEAELERQNERLESFTSVVSHDLRNPLNVAQSSVELLDDGAGSDHVDRIDRSLDRMGAIIEDAVAFARQGDSVESPSPVDLATMAEDAWSHVDTGETTLVVDAEGRIAADADRLKDLLGNLFRNAIEHGDASTVTVGTLEDGFYVADDGSGIPEKHRADVFEAGFSTARQGTGLGLAIVEEIATAHSWDVAVTDSDDGGARVEVTGVTER